MTAPQECPDVTCPRCDGAGRVGWNPTVNHDPQYDEDHDCPLCAEECVVTLTAAEAYLDGAAANEDEFGWRAPDGWSARDFDPVTVTA